MKENRTQWHPAFCSAIKLELRMDKSHLEYSPEHLLNSKPIQIDLLVIKKSSDVIINNEIGRLFKGHNILEYKSPQDALNIDTYYKTLAYACLYKAGGQYTDSISADDLTISIIRQSKPEKFLRLLQEKLYMITNPYPGIYYIQKDGFFATQLIITKELDTSLHRWLTALTDQLNLVDIEQLIYTMDELTEKDEKEYAKSVLSVAFKANKHKLDALKEVEPKMDEAFEVFYEVFKANIDKRVSAAVSEAVSEAVSKAVSEAVSQTTETSNAKWLVHSVNALVNKLHLSLDEACDTLGHTIEEYKDSRILLENLSHSND